MPEKPNPIELRLESTHQSAQPYRWTVVRRSTSETLAYSENYTSRTAAINAGLAVQRGRCTFTVFQGTDRKWYFHLKSSNHADILARSGFKYSARDACEADKELVRLNVATAEFLDYSKAA